MKNRKLLLDNFESSLAKPHNYLRIVNQYLGYLIENDIDLSIKSKNDFLKNKAAVYKTALNKFFKSIDTELPFKVFEVVGEKKYLDIDDSILDGLTKSSKETYHTAISEYKSIHKDRLCVKEFELFIDSLYKKEWSFCTVSTYYSAIKKYFEFNNIWVRFSPKQIPKVKTNKYILSELETQNVWNHILENYDLEIQCIFGLMIFNGLRSVDIIDFRKENNSYVTNIKGGDKATINVNSEITNKIDTYFNKNTKFRFKETSSIRKKCKEVSINSIGIHFSTHSFRHSLSVNLRKKGYDLKEIKSILNHKSFDSTAYYTQE